MTYSIRRAVARAILAGSLLAGLPAGPAAADSGGFGAFPALHPGQRHESPYFQMTVAPGRSGDDAAVVVNSSGRTMRLSVAAVDGLTGQTSGAVFANNDARRRRDALWVTPSVSVLTLAPRTRVLVPFRVHVPAGARPGDHLAGLAVENLDHPRSKGRFQITEIIRVVIGISVRVPGARGQALRLGAVTAAPLGGTNDAALYIPITNAGLTYCKPRLSVRLQDPRAGQRANAVRKDLDTVLPGDRIAYPLAWPKALTPGTYTVAVTAANCGAVITASNPVRVKGTMPSASEHPRSAVSVTPSAAPGSAGVPWFVLLLVGAVGVFIGFLLSRRRREPAQAPEMPPLPATAQAQDDAGDDEQFPNAA